MQSVVQSPPCPCFRANLTTWSGHTGPCQIYMVSHMHTHTHTHTMVTGTRNEATIHETHLHGKHKTEHKRTATLQIYFQATSLIFKNK
jgi:hypothetical protein